MRPLLNIADPNSPRWRAFSRELSGDRTWSLFPWAEVIASGGDLSVFPAFRGPAWLRIESPGDNPALAQAFLRDSMPLRPGELRRPRDLHAGFLLVLAGIKASLEFSPLVRPWIPPAAIQTMFDKVETRQRLDGAGLPTPEGFEPDSVLGLLRELHARRWLYAYLKLRTGASASGLVWIDLRHHQGVSTTVDRGAYFSNTRRLAPRSLEELRPVMQFIIGEGATCERAVPLASLHGCPFDVRMVVIKEQVAFSIFRQNRWPITNLHLGGWRADPEACRSLIASRLWLDACSAAVWAVRTLGAPAAGVDILFHASGLQYFVLEVNPFGDFFHGLPIHRRVLEALALG